MIRGTTPTVIIKIKGCDMSLFNKVYITFKQGDVMVEKTKEQLTINGDVIKVPLTQEDTLSFSNGDVLIQMRAVTESGEAIASPIKIVKAHHILKEGVI